MAIDWEAAAVENDAVVTQGIHVDGSEGDDINTLYLISCKGSAFNRGFACKAKAVVIKSLRSLVARWSECSLRTSYEDAL